MNREQRREQLRDWRRLGPAARAQVVFEHGIDAVPESERHRWLLEAGSTSSDDGPEDQGVPQPGV